MQCPECECLVVAFEETNSQNLCGMCGSVLVEYSAIPKAELAQLRTLLAEAREAIKPFVSELFPSSDDYRRVVELYKRLEGE